MEVIEIPMEEEATVTEGTTTVDTIITTTTEEIKTGIVLIIETMLIWITLITNKKPLIQEV